MITAVDSSIILDILTNDLKFCLSSKQAIKTADRQGRLIICGTVAAEIYPSINTSISDFLKDFRLHHVADTIEQAEVAGKHLEQYCKRNKQGRKIIADFIIAAHAECHADQLLTRDRGYTRDYFSSLKVITPLVQVK